MKTPAPMIDASTLAMRLGVSTRSIWRMTRDGRLPQPHRLGWRVVRWCPQAVAEHLAARNALPPR